MFACDKEPEESVQTGHRTFPSGRISGFHFVLVHPTGNGEPVRQKMLQEEVMSKGVMQFYKAGQCGREPKPVWHRRRFCGNVFLSIITILAYVTKRPVFGGLAPMRKNPEEVERTSDWGRWRTWAEQLRGVEEIIAAKEGWARRAAKAD
ncbi:hypothetical protein CISG_04164 [Coccidioides immitis RMSCC 3703]|uniref:Uncharacterized protein n=1 Tax=Coccidioides immitis RMSCC 3703 TaxID=454286 RepID=A0A0J8QT56_COCIT|nr:hypothetical protein CISG_04164 [Coccidioides immitis RMSCC 3703]